MRLQIVTPPTLDPLDFALSPDGRYLVFVATGSSSDEPQRLYLRSLDQTDARPLAGTEGARSPFWSPDSRSLAFFASEQVLRIDIAGGPAQPLAPAANPQGGAWGTDGTIVFAPTTVSPLFKVPASGGKLTAATTLESPTHTNHRRPFFLPGTRQFLFYATGPGLASLYLGSLDGGALQRVTAAESGAQMLKPDHIVFAQQGSLVARRFDAARGEVAGDPVTVAAGTGAGSSASIGFSASAAGGLAYRIAKATPSRLTWFDRAGAVLGLGADLNAPDISPDGRYVVYDRTIEGNRDVWIMDLVRGGTARFTTHSAIDGYPVWSPDGTRLVFHSQRNGTFDIWIKRFDGASGTEELLLETPGNEWPIDWSKRWPISAVSAKRSELRVVRSLRVADDRRGPNADRDRQHARRGAHGRVLSGRPLDRLSDRRVRPTGDRGTRVSGIEPHRARVDGRRGGTAVACRWERALLCRAWRADDGGVGDDRGRDNQLWSAGGALLHAHLQPGVHVSIRGRARRTVPGL